jgi:hypothetical protein
MATDRTDSEPPERRRIGRLSLAWFLMGFVLFVVGVVGIVIGHGHKTAAGAGVVILGLAAMVWLLGWLASMNGESSDDRRREEEARQYFTEHGHWPGEDGA